MEQTPKLTPEETEEVEELRQRSLHQTENSKSTTEPPDEGGGNNGDAGGE